MSAVTISRFGTPIVFVAGTPLYSPSSISASS